MEYQGRGWIRESVRERETRRSGKREESTSRGSYLKPQDRAKSSRREDRAGDGGTLGHVLRRSHSYGRGASEGDWEMPREVGRKTRAVG